MLIAISWIILGVASVTVPLVLQTNVVSTPVGCTVAVALAILAVVVVVASFAKVCEE